MLYLFLIPFQFRRSWLIPLFRVGLKKDLEFDDLDVCCRADDPEVLTNKLEK